MTLEEQKRIWEYVPNPDPSKKSIERLGNMKPHKHAVLFFADDAGSAMEFVRVFTDENVAASYNLTSVKHLIHGMLSVWRHVA